MTPIRTITTPTSRIEYFNEPAPCICITHAGYYLSVDLERVFPSARIESDEDLLFVADIVSDQASCDFQELSRLLTLRRYNLTTKGAP